MEEDYRFLNSSWWWGDTTTILHRNGLALVEIDYEEKSPNTAFVRGLEVISFARRKGIGTQLLQLCEIEAKRKGKQYLCLNVEFNKEWLKAWYERFGFVVHYIDEHEYLMMKRL